MWGSKALNATHASSLLSRVRRLSRCYSVSSGHCLQNGKLLCTLGWGHACHMCILCNPPKHAWLRCHGTLLLDILPCSTTPSPTSCFHKGLHRMTVADENAHHIHVTLIGLSRGCRALSCAMYSLASPVHCTSLPSTASQGAPHSAVHCQHCIYQREPPSDHHRQRPTLSF